MSARDEGGRPPARDESGRPIVAELGRAETPAEAARRTAASRAERRRNQTAPNLVAAVVASLGVVLFLVAVVVRPDPERPAVDYRQVAAEAQASVAEPLIAPVLRDGWTANRAEYDRGGTGGVAAWRVGLLTPGGQYVALVQGIDANPSWVAAELGDARITGAVRIAGVEWQVADRRDATDPGNIAYALVTTHGASTIVLAGTADDAEFAELATAVAAEFDG